MAYNQTLAGYYSEIRRLITVAKGATPGVFNDTPEGNLYEAVRVMGGTPASTNANRVGYLRQLVGLVRTAVSGTTGTYNENEEGYAKELDRLVGGAASDNLMGWLANAIATGFTTIGGGPPTAIAVTNRLRLMGFGGLVGSDGVDTDSNTRISVYNNSGATVLKMQPVYIGWRADGTNEQAGYNAIPIRGSFEYPAGTFTQFLFVGGAMYLLGANETLTGDEVTLTTPWPAGAQGWVRSNVAVTSGQKWCQGYSVSTTKGEACDFNTGVDKTMSGTITNATATANRRGFGPVALVGTSFGAGARTNRSFAAVGNSILAQAGAANNDAQGNFGWNDRAIAAAGYPHVIYAISGTTLFGNVPANFTRRLAALVAAKITDVVIDWSHNDVSGSQTYAQITTNITNIVAYIKAAGMRVHYCTSLPRVSGTFLTAAGQTYYAPNGGYLGGVSSRHAQVSDFIRANSFGAAGIIDIADAVEVDANNVLTRNAGYWISGNGGNGASNSHLTTTGLTTDNATGDGQHPSDNFSSPNFYGGHWILQDALAAYLAALPAV